MTAQRSRALLVRVAGRDLAVNAADARGATLIERVTPVPRARETLLGLLAVRGELVPLVDVAQLLGSSTPDALGRQALIVEALSERFAFPVDDVLGFANVEWPTEGTVLGTPTEVDGRLVEVLSLERALLALTERVALA